MHLRQKLFQSTSFLAYWLRAVNEHSLHPPFIYNLYTNTIRAREWKPEFQDIENFRKGLLEDHTVLSITDLGAGSSLTSQRHRKIKDIARHSLTRASFSQLLFRLLRHMKSRHILELGTSLGINTLYMSAAAPGGKVYTLEGCPQTAEIAHRTFRNWPLQNIFLKEGSIDQELPEVLASSLHLVDAAYLDANHTYEATIRYFNILLPHLHENSFLIIDDIYWSKEMKKAWQKIQQHERVSISLDLYDAGILFFQKGLQKEHYILEL